MENNKNHKLQIEYGQGLTATSILEVISFNEREVKLSLSSGQNIVVSGENLKILTFNKSCGELKITGVVASVKYTLSASGRIKKIFN